MTATEARAETRPTATTTVVTRIRDRAAATPTDVALRSKDFGLWQETSWAEYWDEIQDVAHALLALGVTRGDRVAIQSENRKEWLTVDLGAVAIGAATVGIYPTNPSAEVVHLLSDSAAKVLLSEDQEQVDKALEVADRTPDLQTIVYVEPRGIRGRYDDGKLMFWEDFLTRGREHRAANPGAVDDAMAQTRPEDLMTLIYTSGTTGLPKGAMLSVANVEATIEALTGPGLVEPPAGPKDLALSYLPLSHVAERIFTTWNNAATGIQVNFAESIETVPANLREIQPTFFFAVPRIWEKLLATVQVKQAAASPMKGAIGRAGMKLAHDVGVTLAANGGKHTGSSRMKYAVAWVLVVRALRERLGLRRVRWAGCGAAPVADDVLKFFLGLGVPIYELYGMTENTASATANKPGQWKLGTVGVAHPTVELRIDEGNGEVLTRGAATFMGYWNRPDATAETIDSDGWLHTGDVGVLDEDGFLRITDRMKDIMITAGGKNIAPSEIENALKVSPYIKEAVLIGDRRPYPTALIGIEPDTVSDWAQQQRISFTTYRDLTEKKEVLDLVQGIVNDVNSRLATVEQIKAFRLLPKLLDHEDGELTATQKVRRSALAESFSGLVESMYRGGGTRLMEEFLSTFVRGLGFGSLYAMLAVSFVIIYKASAVISFAQPALMLAGATLVTYLAGPVGFYLAVPLAAIVMAGVGLGVERTAIRPMIGRPVFVIAIITLGLDVVIRVIVNVAIGRDVRQVGDPWGLSTVDILGITVQQRFIAMILVLIVVTAVLFAFFRYSRWGLAMRAASLDQETAMVQGVSVGGVMAMSWAMAGALAAIAGAFVGTGGVDQSTWIIALKALPAIIIGGLDSIEGAVVGGLLVGVVEAFVAAYQGEYAPWLGQNFSLVSPYVLLLIVLLVKPYGLFGTREVERV